MNTPEENGSDLERIGGEFAKDIKEGFSTREKEQKQGKESFDTYNQNKKEELRKLKYENALKEVNTFDWLGGENLSSYWSGSMNSIFSFDKKVVAFTHGGPGFDILHVLYKKNGEPQMHNFEVGGEYRVKCDEAGDYVNPNAFTHFEKYPSYKINFSEVKLNEQGELEIDFDVSQYPHENKPGKKVLSYKKTISILP